MLVCSRFYQTGTYDIDLNTNMIERCWIDALIEDFRRTSVAE